MAIPLQRPEAPRDWTSSYSAGSARSFNAWDKANDALNARDPNDWRNKYVGNATPTAASTLRDGSYGQGSPSAMQTQNNWQQTQQHYSNPWNMYYGQMNDYNDAQEQGRQVRAQNFSEQLGQRQQMGQLDNALRMQYQDLEEERNTPQTINVTYKGASSRGYDDPLSRSYTNFA